MSPRIKGVAGDRVAITVSLLVAEEKWFILFGFPTV
jgi:hypothetical protein